MALGPGPVIRSGSPLGEQVRVQGDACAPWSGLKKIAFRFAFVYFGLFNLSTALYLLAFPPFTQLYLLLEWLQWNCVLWVSKHILHLSHDFGTDFLNLGSGSKDTTFAYVSVFCFLVIAAITTIVWSLWDRKRRQYVWLHRWFLVYLRLSLTCALIPYGAIKIFPVQFPPASLPQLVEPLGHLIPPRMLWISMGTSPLYTFFTGVMEIAAGLLLVVPRLATVGALLSTAIMGNVVMLNLGYDVKVKLTSINLTLMGLVILLPQLPRLVDFFLLNRSVPALNDPPLFRRRSLARAAVILQIAFGLVLLSYNLYRSHQVAAERAASKQTPLYGVWFVDDYVIDGRPIPPLSSDTHRWHRFIVDSKYDGVVEVMTGVTNYLLMRPDPVNHKLVLTQSGNPNWIAELTYDNATPSSLVLSGKMGGSLVLLRLHREDESKFPLKAWKYSWVFDGER